METLTDILENVNSVYNNALGGFKQELLRVEERLSHPLDLLIVVMVNLATVVEHVANI